MLRHHAHPETDVLIKQIGWQHVDVVEEHLEKYKHL